jgi:hypothetical protein
MGSAGEQPPALQKWRPRFSPLVVTKVIPEGTPTASIKFRVPIPDSRLRVKISLLFVFKAGTMPEAPSSVSLAAGAATLWLYEADQEDAGATGNTIPCTNVEGSSAVPTPIPTPGTGSTAVGLAGYSREFITAGDYIEGVFSTGYNGFLGTWVLQLRYQPDTGQRFNDIEWAQIKGLSKPEVPQAVALS